MPWIRARELAILLAGDLCVLVASLWLTLLVRYFEIPSAQIWNLHAVPFGILFIVWLFVFFITGLYDQHTMVFRTRLPERIVRVQIANVIIAAVFFFFVPIFGIAPKTNLVLYLFISSGLFVAWRLSFFPRFFPKKRDQALLVAGGIELRDLQTEVNANHRYPFYFSEILSVDKLDGGSMSERIFSALRNEKLRYVVIDIHHKKLANILPHLYKPIFSNVQFISARELYEEIFERPTLSVLGDEHSMEQLTARSAGMFYEVTKRIIDIVGGVVMAGITIIIAPFIWLALRIEGKGPLLITQERIGQYGSRMRVYKFRSMTHNESSSASWVKEKHSTPNKVTRVGAILRQTSLDEFPQCINVLKGEMSLIGPRNDIVGLGERLEESIPLYNVRYVVKPGITGWAQVNQQYEQGNISPQSIEETKVRLVYDFYYIKNRSLMLDVIIAFKTIMRMVFRVSSW